jgi:pimeloyl-[acyl-carrier protein] methyl ester esterase
MKDIVMVSGWAMPASVFAPLQARLAAQYRVTLIDLPGTGGSPTLTAPASLAAYAEAVLAAAPERAIWMGWSLGGLVAKHIAVNNPARVSQLVTVASSPRYIADVALQWPGLPFSVFEQFRLQLQEDVTDTLLRFIDLQFFTRKSKVNHAFVAEIKRVVTSAPVPTPAALQAGLTILAETDLRPTLASIMQPWLAIFGRLDAIVPVAVAQLIPPAQTAVIAGAAHMPFMTHIDEFTDIFTSHSQENA